MQQLAIPLNFSNQYARPKSDDSWIKVIEKPRDSEKKQEKKQAKNIPLWPY